MSLKSSSIESSSDELEDIDSLKTELSKLTAENDVLKNETSELKAEIEKRPVESDAEAAPVVKKKRTTKGKPAAIALEALPLQTIESTADVPDEQPSKPIRKSQKRKRRLVLDDVDETGESAAEQPAAGTATDVQETGADVPVATQPAVAPADDPDAIIEQILTQLDTAAVTQGDDQHASPAKESVSWFDLPFELARRDAEGLLSSDTDEDLDQIFSEIGTAGRTDGSKPIPEEDMSIDDLLLLISTDMMLPSVTATEITKIRLGESISINEVRERDVYLASLPRISIHDKGKDILEEDEPVRGNPARETVEFICGDVDFLVQLRDQGILTESFVGYFQDTDVQNFSDFEESSSDESTVYHSPSPLRDESLALGPTAAHEEQFYSVQSPASTPLTSPCLETYTSSTSLSMHFDTDDISLAGAAGISTSLPVGRTEFVEALDDLRAFILQRVDDSNSAILSKLHTLERGLRDTLHDQDANTRKLINSVCQDAHTMSDVQKIHLNDVKKTVLAQGVTAGADSLEIRRAINAVDAKMLSLDGQIGDLVDYIRGGDAKKGEGSSSHPQSPPSNVQDQGSGGNPGEGSGPTAVRLTDIADRI
ncbi:hypothetical protein F511_22432 [Dorcoceras hygrometricum]|uniref:Uncharacterized protein n=1 Tax=Dorcoceras hygrometricum TaxID=472368 RepID=A0A2Z7AYC0_9LAMI|nr:hypothetical protein F511_22432 [Dorcoceras hygrometricum]